MAGNADIVTWFGVFLAGIALNLTPCVYPMMSVTVSLFGKSKQQLPSQSFLRALVYVTGICVMYSALGVAAALTGGFFGALLQSKIVLIVISIFLAVLALSMFGVYSLQFPSWLLTALTTHRPAGWVGLFVSGLLVGVFAAPCIGPAVLTLVTHVGTRGDPVYGFLTFFILSLGLGLPYLIFGSFSHLLHRMPKSGIWMIWVERIFGVVMLSFAAYYLAIALAPAWLSRLIPMCVIAGSIYLGFIEKSGNKAPFLFWMKRAAGIFLCALGLFTLFNPSKPGVSWVEFSDAQLKSAQAENRPVIIDFFADWCIPCHELDNVTYKDSRVVKALDRFVRLKFDVTQIDSEAVQKTAEKFNIIGVPTIIFLDIRGNEVIKLRQTGFVPPEDFLTVVNSSELTPS